MIVVLHVYDRFPTFVYVFHYRYVTPPAKENVGVTKGNRDMSQHRFQTPDQQEEHNLLHQRPQRPSGGRGIAIWLPVLGGIIVIAVLVVVAVLVFLRPGNGGTNAVTPTATTASNAPAATTGSTPATGGKDNTGGTSTTPGSGPQKGQALIGEGDPQVYWDTIKAQVAQGLHLSVSTLTDKLKPPVSSGGKGGAAPTGVTIGEIATQQGVSLSDLHTIEINAIQQATNTLVSQNALSQPNADQRMQTIQSWSQDSLDGYTMYAFQNH